jgi:EAL domain-containing protein (putative c-di-GMP-specific phosphodiesterase class I)
VDAINRISHILGMHTVAESVEDAATLDMIKALGIDYVQGYFIAKPEALLDERDGGGRTQPPPLQGEQPRLPAPDPAATLQRSSSG